MSTGKIDNILDVIHNPSHSNILNNFNKIEIDTFSYQAAENPSKNELTENELKSTEINKNLFKKKYIKIKRSIILAKSASTNVVHSKNNNLSSINNDASTSSIGVTLLLQTANVNSNGISASIPPINSFNLIKWSPLAIAILDTSMRYIAVSQRWLTDYKITRNIIGLSHYEVFPEISEAWRKIHIRAMNGEVLEETEDYFLRSDGSEQWLNWSIGPWQNDDGEIGGIIMFTQEISEQVCARNKSKADEIKLNAILDSMSEAVLIADINGNLIDFNEAFAKYYRFANKQDCLHHLFEYQELFEKFNTDFELLNHNQWAIPRALRGESASEVEVILHRKDTGEFWRGNYNFSPIRDNQQQIIGAVVTARDTTHAWQLQQELFANQQRLVGMVEAAMDGIIFADREQRIQLFNPAAEKIFGYSRQEILNKTISELIPHSLRNAHHNHFNNYAKTGNSIRHRNSNLIAKIFGLRKNVEQFPIEASICQFTLPEGHLFAVILRDISEQELIAKAIEQNKIRLDELRMQLEEAQRHFIIHQTSAAIAHELNQPLTAIAFYFNVAQQLLNTEAPVNTSLQEIMQKIETQVFRAGAVTQELMAALLYKDEFSKELLSIETLFSDALEVLESSNSLTNSVKIIKSFSGDLSTVYGNRTQILKVIINLLSNAAQALEFIEPSIRKITVIGTFVDNNHSMLQFGVCDNGKGLDAAQLSTIFQPFFTTKNSGLGMGLAISRTIIESHGGKLWAESAPNQGSKFYFTLPTTM